jgi:hypothetical protein
MTEHIGKAVRNAYVQNLSEDNGEHRTDDKPDLNAGRYFFACANQGVFYIYFLTV